MRDVIGCSEFQERFETKSLFERVDVLALQVLNALGFDCLSIAELDNAYRNVLEFCDFRRSQTARSGDHFILAFVQFTHQERCQNALRLEAGCQFAETRLIEPLPWIARRLGKGRHGYISIFAVVRHPRRRHKVFLSPRF